MSVCQFIRLDICVYLDVCVLVREDVCVRMSVCPFGCICQYVCLSVWILDVFVCVVKCSSKCTEKMFCRTSDWMAPALPPPDIEFKSYNDHNNLLNKYLSKVKLSICKNVCVV